MTSPRLAWALFGLWVTVALAAVGFAARAGELFDIVLAPLLAAFAVVGALVASRRPENPIGWIIEATALAYALTIAIESYVATSRDPVTAAVWVDDWLSYVWIALACVWIPLLFPDGRLPSRRWRPVLWAATAIFAVTLVGRAFGDRVLDTSALRPIHNAYALPGLAGRAAAEAARIAEPLMALAVLAAVAGLIVRLRRARGVEREQLKWFAYVGGLMLAALFLAAVSLLDPPRLGDNIGTVGWGAFLLLFAIGLPLAMGMAILRHRLYDIDLVIRRTLVYAALTATLAATYLALVLLAGLAVGESDVAIAASTLAVAALFRPVRTRIQAAVDRRFYRSRYDATRTLEAFGARLRDELDLDAVGADLRAVAQETMEPAHVSLWLRRTI
jgi:hypothetical protein